MSISPLILPLILPALFYWLSGITDAIMDTLSSHYSISIFKNFNEQFWNPSVSWRNKYVDGDVSKGFIKWNILWFKITKPVQLTDAWHFLKMMKEVFNVSAITMAAAPYIGLHFALICELIYFIVLGTTRNFWFSKFYDKLLIKK